MRRWTMATIYDVARIAKVSSKTVSRVLNGDAPVNRETRKAVEAAISQLNYVPSSAARTMRSNRSGLIGLVTGAISVAPQPTELSGLPEILIVQAIQRAMEESGRTLLISDTGGHAERVPVLIRTFMEHRVEGIIYLADYHREVTLPPLPQATRLVLVNCYDADGTPSILPDDRECQRRLVLACIEKGHRHIAYLTLRPGLAATPLRIAGYRDALAQAGIAYDPTLVEAGELDVDTDNADVMSDALDGLLAAEPTPTVICCGNDRMAMRVYGLLRSRGHDIPDGMSVAGFDDYRLIAETLFPTLTTVELPYAAMGRRGAERLMRLIAGTDAGPGPPELVTGDVAWRESVAVRRTT
jgi:LacI family transcriptional regulator